MMTDGKPYVKKSERMASKRRKALRVRAERKAKSWRRAA